MLNFIGKLKKYFVFTNALYASYTTFYFVRLWGFELGARLSAGRTCGALGGAGVLRSNRQSGFGRGLRHAGVRIAVRTAGGCADPKSR